MRLRRRLVASDTDGWNVHMKIARIVIASLFAAGSLLAGGAIAEHSAASASHRTAVAGPVLCCDAVKG
jgi:hypothetical protein